MIKPTLILILISASLSAKWQGKTCPKNIKTLAHEAIKLDLSGHRLSLKSKCMKPSNFPHIDFYHTPSQERDVTTDFKVKKIDHMKIVNIKRINDVGLISVDVQVKDQANNNHKLNYHLQLHESSRSQMKEGCVDIIQTPVKVYTLSDCQ